jgi:hypothetical protein
MRNDARPVGHERSPVPSGQSSVESHKPSVTHGSESHIVNREAEENERRDDADADPVMPTGDRSLKTKI